MSVETKFIENLRYMHPDISDLYDEHLKDNDEILSYSFCADITRWLSQRFIEKCGDPKRYVTLIALLNYLEREFATGDDDTKALISLGFLENFPSSGESGFEIRELLGPELKKEIENVNY